MLPAERNFIDIVASEIQAGIDRAVCELLSDVKHMLNSDLSDLDKVRGMRSLVNRLLRVDCPKARGEHA
jgi:predicted peroxiredoxin